MRHSRLWALIGVAMGTLSVFINCNLLYATYAAGYSRHAARMVTFGSAAIVNVIDCI